MPLRNGRATPREIAFSEVYARTGDLGYSAAKAGYRGPSAGVNALARPSVKEKIAAIREARLPELVGLALDVVAEVAQDRSAPASARVAACDKLFKVANQYRETQALEIPIEEQDVGRMLLAINRSLVDLIEHRPGEFGPPAVEEEPGDDPEEAAEPEDIFG